MMRPFVHYIVIGIALLTLKLLTIRISKISTSRYHQALSEFSKILAKFTKITFFDARIWVMYLMRAYVFFEIQLFMSTFAKENRNHNGQRPL